MVHRHTRLAGALSVLVAIAVFVIAVSVFPFHSTNHDEAVYLQQAEMLLHGTLALRPPVETAFRPWFFIESSGASPSGSVLIPKYAPVPAAMFALGKALGNYRFSLPLIAAANVGLTYGVVAEVFDRRTAVLGALFFALSPLFLIQSALFLPYAPTTVWNLAFAFAYLRADRTGRLDYAALAGVCVGTAFFSRPYTAVLFATPFVVHALWTLRGRDRSVVMRQMTTATFGLCGVVVAVGYNALITGTPWLFPYQAFAPHDGLGFGHRAIRGYERTYTPTLALEANAQVVASLFSEWVVAGPLGTVLAVGGLTSLFASRRWDARKAVLAGLFCSVVAGNVFFWGNLNILGALAVPNDGLIEYYGPHYHFDLLVPTAAFAAYGAISGIEMLDRLVSERFDSHRAGRIGAAVLLVSATVVGGTAAVTVADPLRENTAVSARLESGYQPFENRSFDDALVFLPTPYGDWMNHPFQSLRNNPNFDGRVVYALQENQFAVIDAYPDRTLYRYSYRGEWNPYSGSPVDARLQRVRVVHGGRVSLENRLGIPPGATHVSLRVATDRGHAYYVADDPGDTLAFQIVTAGRSAHLEGEVEPVENTSLPVGVRDSVRVTAFVHYGGDSGFDYRIRMPVERSNGTVRALTPYVEICRDPRRCGGEAMFIPNETGSDMSVETRFVTNATHAKRGMENH